MLFLSFFPFALYGMSWSDTSQIFHNGNRILNGEFPYRDFEYQTGFLGIFIDSICQKIFGQVYLSSLICRFAAKFGYIICIYLLLRKWSNRLIATSFCCALALNGIDGFGLNGAHIEGGNSNWAMFLITASALCIAVGLHQDEESFSPIPIGCGGFFAALIFGTRQSTGIVCIFAVSCVVMIYALREPRKYLRQLLIPFVVGILLGFCLLLAFLAFTHSLMEGLDSLLFEASSKKGIQPIEAVIDALSGGVDFSNATLVIKEVFVPLLISLCMLALIALTSKLRNYDVLTYVGMTSTLTLAVVGLSTDIGVFAYDFPRVFFSIALLLGCFFPQTSRIFFGLPHPFFPLLLSLFLGSVWAQQLSWPGRPYVSTKELIILAIVTITLSTKITFKLKRNLSVIFLFFMTGMFSYHALTQSLGTEGYGYKFYEDINYKIDSDIAKHIKVTQLKSEVFSMLARNIVPGETCFISGSAAVLYTLLECENPTRLDITNADALTQDYVDSLLSSLESNPPKWIIDTGRFGGIDGVVPESPFNQLIVEHLQRGLGILIQKYQLIETAQNLPLSKEILNGDSSHDSIYRYRLFKLK